MIVEQWASEELMALSADLTGKQWAGIMTIIKKELEGIGITALLASEDRPCSTSTYYGRWSKDTPGTKSKPGWIDIPSWMRALNLARRDYRKYLLEHGTSEAMQVLAKAAAPSARDLERQVVGDTAAVELLSRQLDQAVDEKDEGKITKLAQALGSTQLSAGLPALGRALEHKWGVETSMALIAAVGQVAAPLNLDRQKAAMGILDRAGEATAAKAVSHEKGEHEQHISFDYSSVPTEALERYVEERLRQRQGSEGRDRGTEQEET